MFKKTASKIKDTIIVVINFVFYIVVHEEYTEIRIIWRHSVMAHGLLCLNFLPNFSMKHY